MSSSRSHHEKLPDLHSATPAAWMSSMHLSCIVRSLLAGFGRPADAGVAATAGVYHAGSPHMVNPRCCTKQSSTVTREDVRQPCNNQLKRPVLGCHVCSSCSSISARQATFRWCCCVAICRLTANLPSLCLWLAPCLVISSCWRDMALQHCTPAPAVQSF